MKEEKEKLIAEFDRIYVTENMWKSDDATEAYAPVDGMRQWIWDAFGKIEVAAYERGRAEERQRCLKALPPERIIHDYIPEENTPANRAWNAYREIAIRAITTPLPDNNKEV